MINSKQLMLNALNNHTVIPAFNVPYLPMIAPIIQAVKDEDTFAFIEAARPDWEKFEAKSIQDVYREYKKHEDTDHIRLHLDHIPVIDEDGKAVDYLSIIKEALEVGFHSVMVDGSRLPFDANAMAVKSVCEIAHIMDIPCEAELGMVMGHESGPSVPYEEIFNSGKGFTEVEKARDFVEKSGCDWLSVAVGNIHGALSDAVKGQKPAAKINIEHLRKIKDALNIPLVLHGGSGIQKEYILKAVDNGICKINVGTEIRQTYVFSLKENGLQKAQDDLYKNVRKILRDDLEISGAKSKVAGY